MLTEIQHILLRALLADDPVATLNAELNATTMLTPQERDWLRHLSPDGLVMTSLLVKKLRFERLTHGEPVMDRLFAEEPDAFMRLYQNYTGTVPPTAYFPQEEAELF